MRKGLKKTYKYCLGVFKCDLCDFVACPLQPSSKKKFKEPPASKAQCPTHLCNLTHMACRCTVVITDRKNEWLVEHNGRHCHPVPPSHYRSLNASTQLEFQKQVMAAPEATAFSLKVRRHTRKSVVNFDKSLHNIARIRRERKKILGNTNRIGSGVADIINLQRDKNIKKFLREINVVGDNPYVVLQDDDMKRMLKLGESCIQTDTVEGF